MESAKGGLTVVRLDYIGPFLEGSFRGTVKLVTDNEVQPLIEIPVYGRILRSHSGSPTGN